MSLTNLYKNGFLMGAENQKNEIIIATPTELHIPNNIIYLIKINYNSELEIGGALIFESVLNGTKKTWVATGLDEGKGGI